MAGPVFLTSAIYLTLAMSFVVSLLETGFGPGLWKHTFRRWGKFLLLLVILGIVIEVLTIIQG
jgi:hypothetical protein